MFTSLREWLHRYNSEEQFFNALPIFFLAIVVLFQQAWVPGFFQDGYLYSAFAKHAAELNYWLVPHMSNSTYEAFPDHSPFIFILQGLYFKVFGSSYTAARIFGGLFTFTTLIILYNWIRDLSGKKVAFYAALLFTIIPPLMKKSRFPNMDTPLMMFILIALYYYTKAIFDKKDKAWLLCGIFFGFSLLTKGPMGMLVPMVIGLHILLSREWKTLINPWAWTGFILGALIFSIWPIALHLNNHQDIWAHYLHSTFGHTITGSRGVTTYNPFTYLNFLFKQSGLWIVLTLATWFTYFKRRENKEVTLFFSAYFLAIFVPLSIAKFKYSHYLMPLYPPLAVLAALSLSRAKGSFHKRFTILVRSVSFLLCLAFLIFPLTTDIRRDRELHKTMSLVETLKVKPTAWAIVDESYPFFAAANYLGYTDHIETFYMSADGIVAFALGEDVTPFVTRDIDIEVNQHRWAFLTKLETVMRLEEELKEEFNNKFVKLAYFNRNNLMVLIPREYFPDEAVLLFE